MKRRDFLRACTVEEDARAKGLELIWDVHEGGFAFGITGVALSIKDGNRNVWRSAVLVEEPRAGVLVESAKKMLLAHADACRAAWYV